MHELPASVHYYSRDDAPDFDDAKTDDLDSQDSFPSKKSKKQGGFFGKLKSVFSKKKAPGLDDTNSSLGSNGLWEVESNSDMIRTAPAGMSLHAMRDAVRDVSSSNIVSDDLGAMSSVIPGRRLKDPETDRAKGLVKRFSNEVSYSDDNHLAKAPQLSVGKQIKKPNSRSGSDASGEVDVIKALRKKRDKEALYE
eukprot:TRINITY_DN36758_c0_g2_i1.p1 TRINITY_DN36758_c0_g2~~TRINITY_DN36758_c0_g2_i1.p1  ORF type:complete len:195 (-),score=59.39 TRINITY_DN36758_c0_g2_i1:15-599(-)